MENHEIEQGARLERIISGLGLTQKAFAQRVSVAQSFVTNMIRGKKGISARVLNGLTENYPQVNIAWLLRGEGEMFIGATSEEPQHGRSVVEEPGERYDIGTGLLERMLREQEQLRRDMEAMRAREHEMAQEVERLQQRVQELEARAVEVVTV